MNKNAKEIVSLLKGFGHEAVFAGGCVRDFLMKIEPKDIDIATSATPDEVEQIFPNTIPVGKQFGVVIVNHGGESFEVATFRKDSKETDGRRPDSIEFSSMEEDAKRRDLTINAMFMDPETEKVIDFVNGMNDIEEGIIRFVGNPRERIEEDKLRILRAVRFASKFYFDFDEETEDAIIENAHRVLGSVSAERIREEIEKMLILDKPSTSFHIMIDLEILQFILPEVDRLRFSPQSPKWHSEGNVFIHTMMVLDTTREKTNDIPTLWAALFHDIAKPHCIKVHEHGSITNQGHENIGVEIWESFAKRFKFSSKVIEKVSFLIKNHMKPNIAKQMKKSTLRKLVAEEHFDSLLILCESDCESSYPAVEPLKDTKLEGVNFLKNFSAEFVSLPEPFINGKDLIDLGLRPGPNFKKILSEVFILQLQETVNSKEEALQIVKEFHLK